LQNQSIKAHYKARNVFAGFFGNPGSKVAWSCRVQTQDPQIPSLMQWQSAMANMFLGKTHLGYPRL